MTAAPSLPAFFPVPRTRLIGREAERESARGLLLEEAVPLLTLTGPGGVGKTRLALTIAQEVAAHFADGVVWVDLAPLNDPALIPAAVAAACRLLLPPDRPLLADLAWQLRSRQTLLLVDNCEHVRVESGALVSMLLARCPALQVLATSRAPLHIQGEQEFPVTPLPLPLRDASPLGTLEQNEAVHLFVVRARAVFPAFRLEDGNATTVASICRHLDGLPLAIELAAARIKLLAPETLATRLEERFSLLTGGPRDSPVRHQTLHHALVWSYDLLSPDDQALFRQFGVFLGGWTLEAAEAIGRPAGHGNVLQGLGSLIDASMVRVEERGRDIRYSMLETVRAFALEQLDRAGERAATRERHAAYYLAFAERAARELEGIDQRHWLGLLEQEHPNLREAFATLEALGRNAHTAQLANALAWYWLFHAHAAEGLQRLESVLARQTSRDVAHAGALFGAGMLAYACGAYAKAERWLQEGEVLARALGEMALVGDILIYLGAVAEQLGDEARAQHCFAASLAIAEEIGHGWLAGVALFNLSDAAYRRGDLEQAEQHALAATSTLRASGNAYVESVHAGNLAQVALARGAIRDAATAWYDGLRLAQEIENQWGVANALGGAASVSAALGQFGQAARLLGAAAFQCERAGYPRLPHFGLFTQTQERVQQELPPAACQAAWEAGRALPLEDAVTEAQGVFAAARETDSRAGPAAPASAAMTAPDLPLVTATPVALTPREREVLALLCQRYTDPEIADRLFISPKTAGHHVSRILGKLGAANRRQAAAIAARQHLI